MANEYITVAELKAALRITDAGQDTNLATAAEAASRWVDRKTGRRFYPDADVNQQRKYMPVSPNYLLIDDLITLTSLVDGSGTWTIDTDFVLQPDNAAANGRPWDTIRTVGMDPGTGWPEFWQEPAAPAGKRFRRGRVVTITGKFGWAAPPPEVKQAVLILAAQFFLRPRQAVFGVVGLGFEGEGMRIPGTDPNVFSALTPYVRSGMVE